jgi:hypothetical protein
MNGRRGSWTSLREDHDHKLRVDPASGVYLRVSPIQFVVTANAPNISVMVNLPELWFPASRGISSHLPNRPDSKRCTLQPSPPRASRRFRGLEFRPVPVTTQHLHKGSGTSLRDDPDHGLRAGPKGGPSPLGRRKC